MLVEKSTQSCPDLVRSQVWAKKIFASWFGSLIACAPHLRLCSTCPKNLIRRAENLLGALFRDGVSVRAYPFVEPRLDVTTRVVCSFQAQRSTPLAAESAPRIASLTGETSSAALSLGFSRLVFCESEV